ncbi:unnamed protein product [Aphanomyces euteiches]|uniref:ABC transporter domain-containing protein n=1 Tax=Aphanomyces euteiches TaxID=100861 RepID=A0A6G0X1G8_9STRA|nr:hypothetical protein Ae201684_009500 [Aphanomyces euteiches]
MAPSLKKPSARQNMQSPRGGAYQKGDAAMRAAGSQSRGGRVGCLHLIDNRKWHYFVMFLLVVDFFLNTLGVSFLSQTNYYTWAEKLRLGSAFCCVIYLLDMLLRIVTVRSALCRSLASILDIFALMLVGGALAMRFVKADDPMKIVITQHGWLDDKAKNPMHPKYVSNQIEIYMASAYCLMIALRIVLKPQARVFSKKLHNHANSDHLLISIESLRASLKRIPNMTEASIELMETDLVMVCGRNEGEMSRDELMRFLERALRYRPKEISASAFLSHLRDIDAQSSLVIYGAGDVVRSTLRHWSNQRVDLFLTILIVLVNASFVPLMSYFLNVLTDEAFPQQATSVPITDPDHGYYIRKYIRYQNVTTDTQGQDVILDYIVPDKALKIGVWGTLLICIPFAIVDYLMGYFQSKMISKATERMQLSLLQTILAQPTLFFAQRTEGDLNNLFQSDIARVNALWQAVFWNLMQPIVSVIAGFSFLIYFEPSVGMVCLGFAAMIVSTGPQGHASKKSKDFGSKSAYASADFQNAISCQKVVRAYGIQDPIVKKFDKTTLGLSKSQFLKDLWASVVQIYVDSAMFFFIAVMTAALAVKVFNTDITAGDFISAVTLMSRVSTPVTVLGGFMRVAIGNASSLQRLDEILNDAKTINDPKDDDKKRPAVPRMKHALRVDHLSFQYDVTSDRSQLQDVSCTFPAGHYVCIVGPSGCGKSTLLGCLMQFYDPTEGVIALDNNKLAEFSKSSFMSQIAVVFQDGGILNGSILENIRFGNINATDAECMEAAELAECCAFINGLKNGFETIVGQHATVNLSGGQTQRICLARALVRKPTILLLDEATSALDAETEASIIENLQKVAKKLNMTVISVTHRLSTTRTADSILVMQDGRVVDRGTYHELLARPQSAFADLVQKTTAQENRRNRNESTTRTSFSFHNPHTENPDESRNTQAALEMFTDKLRKRRDSKEGAGAYLRKNSTQTPQNRQKGPSNNGGDDYIVL